MMALYFFIAVFSLLLLWFGTAAMMTFLLWIFCMLFGKNPAPATIPNKAVWG
jgi:hypothetical protein